MNLSSLKFAAGSRRKAKRIGRGVGSGHGGTSTRGHKGYHSRSGSSRRVHFEGGQMPIHRRLPKRGFHNIFKQRFQLINLRQLQALPATEIDVETLKKANLVKKIGTPVKLLGEGEITRKVKITVNAVSQSARSKIEAVGGEVVLL